MRILVLCGDHWHPARVPREGLGALANAGLAFDWIEDARAWPPESLAAYPLVILAKSNNVSSTDESPWMTDAVQSAFAEYVRAGNGLLAIHSGTAGYDQAPVLRRLLGGIFLRHPDQCLVTLDPNPKYALCSGSVPFTLKDEHYFMEMDDPAPEVFTTTRSEHGEQPGAWRRTEGDGRVAVLTPGHNLEVWLHPSFQRLLLNLMRWCGKVP